MLACDAVIAWEPEFASLAAAVGMEDAAGTDADVIKRLLWLRHCPWSIQS